METAKTNPQPEKKKMNGKKLALIAGVTVLVIIAAVLVDNMIRNPRCRDETDAMNVIIQKVLPSLDEIADDEGFGLEVQELETIGDSDYYPVFITRFPKCPDEAEAKRVVENRVLPDMNTGGEVELTLLDGVTMMDAQSMTELPYFVVEVSRTTDGKKEVLETIYVRQKNSQPFVIQQEGVLTPLAEEEELLIATIYVRIKDSQPFQKDDTTGQLVPYGG